MSLPDMSGSWQEVPATDRSTDTRTGAPVDDLTRLAERVTALEQRLGPPPAPPELTRAVGAFGRTMWQHRPCGFVRVSRSEGEVPPNKCVECRDTKFTDGHGFTEPDQWAPMYVAVTEG